MRERREEEREIEMERERERERWGIERHKHAKYPKNMLFVLFVENKRDNHGIHSI